MKTSPLQLEWIAYPKVSIESNAQSEELDSFLETNVRAVVHYMANGRHFARVSIDGVSSESAPYQLAVEAVSCFSFDASLAKQAYGLNDRLPYVLAANVSRIIYASAREFVSMIMSRAPGGVAMIRSIIIEPGDVEISSDVSAETILRDVFQIEQVGVEATQSAEGGSLPAASKPRATAAARATSESKGKKVRK